MAAAGPCALRITCPTDSEGRTLTGAADHLPPPTVRAVAGHHLAPPPQHGSRARDGRTREALALPRQDGFRRGER